MQSVHLPLHNAVPVTPATGALSPLSLAAVSLAGGFWGDRQNLNSSAIIPHAVSWVTRLDWVANLEKAAGGEKYEHRGREFADSEIYKLIEAMSWEHARSGETELDEVLDAFIDKLAAAQDPDGYLHTLFGRPWQQPRYSDFKWGHELYCFGHLIQAAVANHRATGATKLLNVARKLADHVCTMFGEHGLNKVCGHAEIEVALVELYRVTNERRYLDQAKIFIERRGTGTLPLFEFGQAYWQDDLPVRAATVLRGHAVRALYLAAGAVDVAVETGDSELLDALKLQWQNTVARRTYITGGMGSHHMDEAFGEDFVLPPDRSYCETCAGVASMMFSWRLLLATGETKYADLIERTLYNIVATSPAPDGKTFFYANTLHQRTNAGTAPLNDDGVCIRGGSSGREAWFEVSCCPPNVARTLASLGAYIATKDDQGVQIHQYAASRIQTQLASGLLVLDVDTNYPATGRIKVAVAESPDSPVTLSLRVPAWAQGAILDTGDGPEPVSPGSVSVTRSFQPGEEILLDLPLEPRFSWPDERIDAVRGCVAVERGPEVFALESVDLPAGWELEDARIDAASGVTDNEGAVTVKLVGVRPPAESDWPFAPANNSDGTDGSFQADVPLVPYHSWAERGSSTMRIWIPTTATSS
ncbi:glycoside hydrolase family 127 protein [Pseudarthrobacter sp. NPDC055928]|uniref:glycoside hydrolase family 127 protein n=1 Tax=Pseudarthrobacter sp. NPDC055928 TaxID=3345661 RepID=UPI0035DEB9A3